MKKPTQFKPKHGIEGKRFNGRAAIDVMYDEVWNRYRTRYLHINQQCYSCGSKSEVVDHLIPHKGEKSLFEKTDNHIPLCHRCHNTLTAKFDRNFRPGNSIEPKLRWLSDNRARNQVTTRVKVLPSYG